MKDEGKDLVQRLVEQERQRLAGQAPVPLPAPDPPGIHHTQLAKDDSGEPLAREWNVYRLKVGRLLAEGHEGRHVLIKDEDVLGIFDTWDAARAAGLARFLGEPFFVHPIRTTEPHLRLRGINQPWPSCKSRKPSRPDRPGLDRPQRQ
jgi:hypothetical protein